MWFLIFCVSAVIGLIYYWFTKEYTHFKNRGISGPEPKFPLGNVPSFITQKRNIVYDYDDIYQKFRGNAPFVGYLEIRTPSILLIAPETVKRVLVQNFKNFHDNSFSQMINRDKDPIFGRNPFMLTGDQWKEKRAEITPAFTPTRIKAMSPLVEDVANRLTKHINDEIKSGKPFDIREICAKYTTDVVSSCIFNIDAESFTKENPEIREMGKKLFQFTPFLSIMFVIYTLFPSFIKIFKAKFVPKDVEDFFANLMYQAILYREKNQIKRDDYLAYLISLRDKKQLSDIDMAAHGATFLIDGMDTSSMSIANTIYELAANKTAQDKLRNEVEGMFDQNGKIIYDSVLENEYLDQAIHEGLRLHPLAIIMNRECTEPIQLEGTKGKMIQFKKGDSINIPVYSIHRDPEFYSEPEKFQPERFNPENGGVKAFQDKGVFLGFGAGPRICLGMKFAMMQTKIAIAELIRNFEVSVNEKTQLPLTLDPKEILNVKTGGIWINFKALKDFE